METSHKREAFQVEKRMTARTSEATYMTGKKALQNHEPK